MNNNIYLTEYRGDKLRFVRLIKGVSLDELGSILDVTRQNIHKMEAGQEPKEHQLELLSNFLEVKPQFFYAERNTPIVEEQCHFRSLRSRTKTLTNTIMARAELLDSIIKEVETNFDLLIFQPPHLDIDIERPENIEKISENLRRHWDLGNGPISNITIIVENAGIIVSSMEGVDEKVDAFSLSRQRPIIIRNSAKNSPCRYRFDLAHELGHLIMHDGVITGCKKTEKQANYFASAFLMPRVGFADAINRLPIIKGAKSFYWNNLYKLKKYFKVSFKAILYRAKSLGIISDDQMRSGYIQINKKGWAKNEFLDDEISQEKPSLLDSMISELNISTWNKLLEKLGLTDILVRQLLPNIRFPQPLLRSIT
ncbi:MAG: ImmA/IrrE family metallo-endopeptidase [Ectothiorhodospiraceae bacterium]|nr:ImmA/IrrE family metallo-endopeptidase [Thiotrichaceae bacterium]MBL1277834.1 ImmA/IrrE family metallo-endopeptidase [Ectothiorhodospiraceae bacterium]